MWQEFIDQFVNHLASFFLSHFPPKYGIVTEKKEKWTLLV